MRKLALAVVALAFIACKSKMEKLGDQIAAGSVEIEAPRCKAKTDTPQCLSDATKFFAPDAKFDEVTPDQASASAMALLVFDGYGSWSSEPPAWLATAKVGKGAGGDALRLAIGRRLADGVPALGHKLDDDADGRKLLAVIARAIPGACSTYEDLGAGADPNAMSPAQSPDHSSCVQKDLVRGDGPGGAYGFGLWRGVAGGLALLKEAVRSLDLGSALMSGTNRATLVAWVNKLKPAVAAIAVKQVDRPVGNAWSESDHSKPLK